MTDLFAVLVIAALAALTLWIRTTKQFSGLAFTGWVFTGVAAGIVLVGAAPGGVASNVMTYLAGGNVALSVTMTACSTLLSPVMTPLAMQTYAGRFVPINFVDMMISIFNMIIVPIVAGLVVNRLI